MPTSTQIAAASVLTQERAFHLLEIVRASDAYLTNQAIYSDLETLVIALVDATPPGSDDEIKSRMLDANLTAFDDDIEDGTIGVKGGPKGADYSQSRDREDIVKRILGLLYQTALGGVAVDGTSGVYAAQPMTGVCCNYCRSMPCCCRSRSISWPW